MAVSKPTRTLQDLLVWQNAHRFVLEVYAFTAAFPKHETYSLSLQMRRAAVSIPANIAEGFRRRSKADKARFTNMAEGGLTNILEKSLGAVAKGGTSPLIDVYDYAERVTAPGFCFMNTPGYDAVSLTGLAAGGCNLIAFTTGRGSAIGFPTIPVIKIATNSNTYSRMTANMDVNAGAIADGESTVKQTGRAIFNLMLEVAGGRHTCAERLGHKEFVPWRIGPVM